MLECLVDGPLALILLPLATGIAIGVVAIAIIFVNEVVRLQRDAESPPNPVIAYA